MNFKSLLFPIQKTTVSDLALPRVVEFAEALNADLICVAARAPIFLTDPWIVSAEIVQQLTDDEDAQFKAAEARFRSDTATLKGRAHWRARRDYPNIAVKDEAAGADLIVTTLETGPESTMVGLSSLVLESGLPVIALPSPAPTIRTETLLVAWRNTADARRAVTMAMPLLETAKAVSVVQIVRPNEADDAWPSLRAVKERLRLHGVNAEVELVFKNEEADSDALLSAAQQRGAQMIVLGGYGHARAREWILGGVTQDLLSGTSIPLFMVH